MKSAFLVSPQKYELRDIPDPVCPDDGLILNIEACGVCGSDVRRWKEGPPPGTGSYQDRPGIVAGHEAAGTVVAIGEKLTGYAIGERLAVAPDIHCGTCYYCRRGMFNLCDTLHFLGITPGYPGGFAEKMVLTREVLTLGIVHRIPEGLSSRHAALSEPASSVLACHQKAGTGPKDTVVVMGAGPIGCLHTAIAKARGARVILSEPNATRRDMAAEFAPDVLVDPFNEDLEVCVRRATGGVGADLVVCANPVAATQTHAVEIVRKAGRVVLFGGLPKASPMTTLDSNRIHYGEIEVIGAFSYHPTTHALALDVLRRGLIPADKLITHTFPLDDIAIAVETAASGAGLKVIIVPKG